jgi:response regulator RpfG family c-di-GMP phosphodiesterase
MTVQRTVLHVDDDPEFLELSERLFDRAATFETLTAPTAEDGIRLLETHEVDCVISDFVVSTDGTPFISAARDVDVDVPIILFTGKEWDLVSNDAFAANVTEYVQKAGVEEIQIVKSRVDEFLGEDHDSLGSVVGDVSEPAADGDDSPSTAATARLGDEWQVVGHHDWEASEELGTTLFEAVESFTGEEPEVLTPLFETIDADALEELLAPTPSGHERSGIQVRFPYKRYELAVTSGGEVAVRPLA